MENKRVYNQPSIKTCNVIPREGEKDIVNTIEAAIKNNPFDVEEKDVEEKSDKNILALANEILNDLNKAGFMVIEQKCNVSPRPEEKNIANIIATAIQNNTLGIESLTTRNILANEILDALNEVGFIVIRSK